MVDNDLVSSDESVSVEKQMELQVFPDVPVADDAALPVVAVASQKRMILLFLFNVS